MYVNRPSDYPFNICHPGALKADKHSARKKKKTIALKIDNFKIVKILTDVNR